MQIKEYWKPCRYCGEIHKWGSKNCSAYGKSCRKCGKSNHIAKVCRSSNGRKMKDSVFHVTFLVNEMKEVDKMIVYDNLNKEFAGFLCPPNPTAEDVIARLIEFHKVPEKLCLRFQHHAYETFYNELAESLRYNRRLDVAVIYDPNVKTFLKQVISSRVWKDVGNSNSEN